MRETEGVQDGRRERGGKQKGERVERAIGTYLPIILSKSEAVFVMAKGRVVFRAFRIQNLIIQVGFRNADDLMLESQSR